jgi:hypothetical protein
MRQSHIKSMLCRSPLFSDRSTSIDFICRHAQIRRIMSNWITNYHHALMLRLMGILLFLGAWIMLALIGRLVWHAGSSLLQRPAQRVPVWHDRP